MAAWQKIPLATVFSTQKGFSDPWIGNAALNKAGLHTSRMRLAHWCAQSRKMMAGRGPRPELIEQLNNDGIAVIPNFIPDAQFDRVQLEARDAITALEAARPATTGKTAGFGAKQFFDGGFDRYDGSTLNRFINVSGHSTPAIHDFVAGNHWQNVMRAACTRPLPARKVQLYLTLHGPHDEVADPQKALHRDSFHRCIKFWLFLEEVRPEDGPFCYAVGSHRLTPARLAWERQEALARCSAAAGNKGGSFRISQDPLAALGFAEVRSFLVAANTLVIADTSGFHARGHAKAGARRLALYGHSRPYPFNPFA